MFNRGQGFFLQLKKVCLHVLYGKDVKVETVSILRKLADHSLNEKE